MTPTPLSVVAPGVEASAPAAAPGPAVAAPLSPPGPPVGSAAVASGATEADTLIPSWPSCVRPPISPSRRTSGRYARWPRPAAGRGRAGQVRCARPDPGPRRHASEPRTRHHRRRARAGRIKSAHHPAAGRTGSRCPAGGPARRRARCLARSSRRRRPPARTAYSAADRPNLGRPPPAAERQGCPSTAEVPPRSRR